MTNTPSPEAASFAAKLAGTGAIELTTGEANELRSTLQALLIALTVADECRSSNPNGQICGPCWEKVSTSVVGPTGLEVCVPRQP